jgi:hypothetical protein
MTAKNKNEPLFVSHRNITSSKLDDFTEILNKSDQSLATLFISDLNNVCIGADGKVANRYTYSYPAFRQVGNSIGPGLSSFLILNYKDHVDNLKNKEDFDSDKYGNLIKYVAGTFNRVVKFNLNKLAGTKFIVSNDSNLIDGHIGRRFIIVRNKLIFSQALELADSMADKPKFVLGSLYGRDMTAIFISEKTFLNKNNCSFKRGFLVQNREVSGRAIRFANLIYCTEFKGFALDSFYPDTRINHVSAAKLIKKVSALSDTMQSRQLSKDIVSQKIDTALNSTVLNSKVDLTKKFQKKLASWLAEGGVSSYRRELFLEDLAGLASRRKVSKYDMFGLMIALKSVGLLDQDVSASRLAYQLLFA